MDRNKESLHRAEIGESLTNYPAIYEGFQEKGILESDIKPRINIFTFPAWKAKGRIVRKGEKGIKIFTFREVSEKRNRETGKVEKAYKIPWRTTVFHVSQTDQL